MWRKGAPCARVFAVTAARALMWSCICWGKTISLKSLFTASVLFSPLLTLLRPNRPRREVSLTSLGVPRYLSRMAAGKQFDAADSDSMQSSHDIERNARVDIKCYCKPMYGLENGIHYAEATASCSSQCYFLSKLGEMLVHSMMYEISYRLCSIYLRKSLLQA